MSRLTNTARCRLCRREGQKLFLKGDRCLSSKCSLERRQTAPGMHGERRGRKQSDYAMQLREKQRLKRIYGMREAQFRKFFATAETMSGNTGENFLRLLERRLGNVVYRMGFMPSGLSGRKLVSHGHVRVNGHKVNRQSFLVREGDEVQLAPTAPKAVIEANLKAAQERGLPGWVEVTADALKGTVKAIPTRDDIAVPVDINMVVTYYSK